ncbi:hypothetical protein [Herbaspirillum rubrisubalbicans]|uniref:Thioesterase domain-containing protein n=1 Tax=Herbaspirillum rubrisubalbicans TaxID=80842 RepID=A0ABX9C883_9BURK|nr:hypothetical protein [Herbaspirillum rubrisubalbicans]RAM67147.1 hypothetical protein RB24_02255 [Herbaspirillum rubrisubalbicans]
MIPQAIIVVTAALTLKSDTSPVTVKVNKPRGTIYWGGAGLNGGYISDQIVALQEVGIKDVFSGTRTYTQYVDAFRSGTTLRYKNNLDSEDWTIHGMEKIQSPQFNMIGYSYGSLLAAHTALFYAENGHIVDHLILVASPIDGDFLADLKKHPNIKSVVVKDIPEYGDPLFAGMSQVQLISSALKLYRQMSSTEATGEGVGHFYYASATSEGARRRRNLAAFIYRQGVR